MIYAIGRNYASHAKEMGNELSQGDPVVFFKPDGSKVSSGEKIKLPDFSKNVQFEVELALKLGKNLDVIEFCVANDLTARDKQREAQEQKKPWALAKGFKQSCGLGNWVNASGFDFDNLELKLIHNDRLAQHGFTKEMIYKVPTILEYLTKTFPLQPGDVILTGTPEGVATLKQGDIIKAELFKSGQRAPLSSAQWHFE